MKNTCMYPVTIAILCFLHLSILGCAGTSPPSKYYMLTALQKEETQQLRIHPDTRISLRLAPVDIPDYLDRPQIMSRKGKNQLHRAEFERWAGPLRENIYTVLRENLSVLLPTEKASLVSWDSPVPSEYLIAVEITHFEAVPHNTVLLTARWTILEENGKTVAASGETHLDEKRDGQEYDDIVSAMSRALGALSRQLAQEVASVTH